MLKENNRHIINIIISEFVIISIIFMFFVQISPVLCSFFWQMILYYFPGFVLVSYIWNKYKIIFRQLISILISIILQVTCVSILVAISIFTREYYLTCQIIFWIILLLFQLYKLYVSHKEVKKELFVKKRSNLDNNKGKTITFVKCIFVVLGTVMLLLFQNLKQFLRGFPTDRFSYAFVSLTNYFSETGNFNFFLTLHKVSPLDNAYISILSFPFLIIANSAIVISSDMKIQEIVRYPLINYFFIALAIGSIVEVLSDFKVENKNKEIQNEKILFLFLIVLGAPDTLYRIFTNPTGGGLFTLLPISLIFFSLALKIVFINTKHKFNKIIFWSLLCDWIIAFSYHTHFAFILIMNALVPFIMVYSTDKKITKEDKRKILLLVFHIITQISYLTILIIIFLIFQHILLIIPSAILSFFHISNIISAKGSLFIIPSIIYGTVFVYLACIFLFLKAKTKVKTKTKQFLTFLGNNSIVNEKFGRFISILIILFLAIVSVLVRYYLIRTNKSPTRYLHPIYYSSSINNVLSILSFVEYGLIGVLTVFLIVNSFVKNLNKKLSIHHTNLIMWFLVLLVCYTIFSPLIFISLGAQFVLTRSLYYLLTPMLTINCMMFLFRTKYSNDKMAKLKKIYRSKGLKILYFSVIMTLSLTVQFLCIYSPVTDDLSKDEYYDIKKYFQHVPNDGYILSDLRICNAMIQITEHFNFWILDQTSKDFDYLLSAIFYNNNSAIAHQAIGLLSTAHVKYVLISEEFVKRGIVMYDYWYKPIPMSSYEKFWDTNFFEVMIQGEVLTLLKIK